MRLILLLLPLSFFAKADMDYVCYIDATQKSAIDTIEKSCTRNNILYVVQITKTNATWWSSNFCRFDRQIKVDDYFGYDVNDMANRQKMQTVICVLYNNKSREHIGM